MRNPARPHLGTVPDGCPSGVASTATSMPPRSSLVTTSVPRRSATPRLESLRVAETLRRHRFLPRRSSQVAVVLDPGSTLLEEPALAEDSPAP